jgi:ABC-type sugar transport system substrate-binding protein
VCSSDLEYYLDIEVCLRKRAEELGVELLVQNADTVLSAQVQQIEDFIARKVDAIMFAPVDPIGAYACVEAANAAGIPIFEYDGSTENLKGVAAHTTEEFIKEGEKAGEWAKTYIEKNWDGKATYAVLDYFPSPVVCGGRTKGFMDIVDTLPGVERVALQDGKATRDGGMAVMEDILTANKNNVDLVFCINYESGAGAAAAIEAAGAKTKVVCVAWNAEGFEKLENKDKYMQAYLMPDPNETAKLLDVIKDALDGKQISETVFQDYYMVDQDTISEFDWRSIVAMRAKYN